MGIPIELNQLGAELAALSGRIKTKVEGAARKTSYDAVEPIQRRAPKAFGNLHDSVHAGQGPTPTTVVSAPHAAAVEVGSRPHTPPLQVIIEWVKLRGMQGLTSARTLKGKGLTKWDVRQGRMVAAALRKHGQVRASRRLTAGGPHGTHTLLNVVREVAKSIQMKIARTGTKPTHFVAASLQDICKLLDANIKEVL